MNKKVRVRFAPSPTGGLHIGGVRTVLYNYLFAKQQSGDFILRIEDTDQSRFVPGAEDYIFNCLRWLGLEPDESPAHGGPHAPYRQSERKEIYRKYALELIEKGRAYYAFDTPEELDEMRKNFGSEGNHAQYDGSTRMGMKNQLTLSPEEVAERLQRGDPHVVRIKMPETPETIVLNDMIRGEVKFDSAMVDDKVLLKADGMPTYHLAVVVDDHLMEITHAFRGEEWLPSAPVHVLVWRYLFGEEQMPQWVHLPLILGPNGKLSKRDGAKYGFPVFAMNWTDPKTNELTEGFREKGFVPEALINLLALLGWNDGTEQEIFSKKELIQKFSMERVHSAGARFDYDKAKWFNHEWIKEMPVEALHKAVSELLVAKGITINDSVYLDQVIASVKARCTLIDDFYEQSRFYFEAPATLDTESVKPKWNQQKLEFFTKYIDALERTSGWTAAELESGFKELAGAAGIKAGELLLPLRVMLVGGKFGPAVFDIAALLGKEQTISRIRHALAVFG